MRATLLAATFIAPAAMAQQAPVTSVTIALDPPVDLPMLLTIRDQRSLPNGTAVTFTVVHHLRFARAENGWRATITQQSAECSGPDTVCRVYAATMAVANRIERHFAISREGVILPLSGQHAAAAAAAAAADADADAGGEGRDDGVNAGVIVAVAESDSPGALASGELREALRYAHQQFVLDASSIDPPAHPSAHPSYGITARALAGGLVEITSRWRLETIGQAAMIRRNIARVDPGTGLSTSGMTETWSSLDDRVAPMSVRTWALAALAAQEVAEGAPE
ncbi:MAG: hypothetical protein ABL874_08385 [Sphingopyxis sp.]